MKPTRFNHKTGYTGSSETCGAKPMQHTYVTLLLCVCVRAWFCFNVISSLKSNYLNAYRQHYNIIKVQNEKQVYFLTVGVYLSSRSHTITYTHHEAIPSQKKQVYGFENIVENVLQTIKM